MKDLEGFPAFADAMRLAWHVPGLAVAVVKDDKLVHIGGYGDCHHEQGMPVQPETSFVIGSCTKAFTAVALGILVDEGRLAWDTPLRQYLPQFRMFDKFATERITICDLLCHRSGLPPHEALRYQVSPTARQSIVASMPYLEPNKDFRSTFQYGNIVYTLAGHVVEQLSGRSWEAFIRESLFDPLSMDGSDFVNQPLPVDPNRATPHIQLPDTEEVHPTILKSLHPCGPANSILTNVLDMSKWLLMNLQGGQYDGTQIISKANLQQCHTPQIIVPRPAQYAEIPSMVGYGFGWFVKVYRGYQILFHTGGITGFTAWVSLLPEQKIGMVIVTNLDQTPLPAIICYQIYDRLLGLEPIAWHERIQQNMIRAKAIAPSRHQPTESSIPSQGEVPHPLTAYIGEFRHPGYGMLSVGLENGGLTATYYSLVMDLHHREGTTFEGVYENPYTLRQIGRKVTFGVDATGQIRIVSIPLEPAVADIVFTRITPE